MIPYFTKPIKMNEDVYFLTKHHDRKDKYSFTYNDLKQGIYKGDNSVLASDGILYNSDILIITPINDYYKKNIDTIYKKMDIKNQAMAECFEEIKNYEQYSDYYLKDYESFTEFQRILFEKSELHCNELDHVNFFKPSACYYPKGWYDLGGEESDESNAIGEIVEMKWQAWRNALFQNKILNTCTFHDITVKSI